MNPQEVTMFNRSTHARVPKAFARAAGMPVMVAALLLTLGCATQPQVVAFNYSINTVPDAAALIAGVRNGGTSVASLLPATPCTFWASFERGLWRPAIQINGNPGASDFNLRFSSATPVNVATTNAPSCPQVSFYDIVITGSPAGALGVGGQTSSTSGVVEFGALRFGTNGYFNAGLQAFDPATRRVTGHFQFVNPHPTDANTVLIVDGQYNVR